MTNRLEIAILSELTVQTGIAHPPSTHMCQNYTHRGSKSNVSRNSQLVQGRVHTVCTHWMCTGSVPLCSIYFGPKLEIYYAAIRVLIWLPAWKLDA